MPLDTCPFCGHTDARLYRQKQPYRDPAAGGAAFYLCEECGIIYPRPRFDTGEAEAYVGSLYSGKEQAVAGSFFRLFNFEESTLRGVIRRRSPRTALDIGCNTGSFMRLLEGNGIRATGIEASGPVAEAARSAGLEVFQGVFPGGLPPELAGARFDLVTMNEVICYFTDLKEALRSARDLLSPRGTLYVKIYLGENLYRQDGGRPYFLKGGDYLQSVFTEGSLRFCLGKAGFRVTGFLPYPDFAERTYRGAGHLAKIFHFARYYYARYTDAPGLLGRATRAIILAEPCPPSEGGGNTPGAGGPGRGEGAEGG